MITTIKLALLSADLADIEAALAKLDAADFAALSAEQIAELAALLPQLRVLVCSQRSADLAKFHALERASAYVQ